MSRSRKDRGATGSEEHQLWHSVRAHLRSIEKLQAATTGDITSLESHRSRFIAKGASNSRESSVSVDEGDRSDLIATYRRVEGDLQEEHQEVSRALDTLAVLLAVRVEGDGDAQIKRKKRRVDGASQSPPPPLPSSIVGKDRALSPLSHDEEAGTPSARKRGFSKSNSSATGAGAGGAAQRRMTASSAGKDSAIVIDISNGASAAGPGKDNYVDPARARREVLGNQLPLQKGRKVAFRQPSKTKLGPGAANAPISSSSSSSSSTRMGGAAAAGNQGLGGGDLSSSGATAEEEGETWIMATVIECINNDRNRYVVQDEEDPAMPTYNTTLKAVVPLPESLSTLPLEDYRAGTPVLGLYPDTSCFYRAIVRSGGPGRNGKTKPKMARKADEVLNTPYQLEFEDDEGAIRDVAANLVVERP